MGAATPTRTSDWPRGRPVTTPVAAADADVQRERGEGALPKRSLPLLTGREPGRRVGGGGKGAAASVAAAASRSREPPPLSLLAGQRGVAASRGCPAPRRPRQTAGGRTRPVGRTARRARRRGRGWKWVLGGGKGPAVPSQPSGRFHGASAVPPPPPPGVLVSNVNAPCSRCYARQGRVRRGGGRRHRGEAAGPTRTATTTQPSPPTHHLYLHEAHRSSCGVGLSSSP